MTIIQVIQVMTGQIRKCYEKLRMRWRRRSWWGRPEDDALLPVPNVLAEREALALGLPCSFTNQLGFTASGARRIAFSVTTSSSTTLAQQNGFRLTKALKALRELDEKKYEAALVNLKTRKGEVFAADFGSRVDLAIYRVVVREQTPAQRIADRLDRLLQRRVRAQGPWRPWRSTSKRFAEIG